MEKKEIVLSGKVAPTINMKNLKLCTCSECIKDPYIYISLELDVSVKKDDLIKLLKNLENFSLDASYEDGDHEERHWELTLREV